MFLFIYVACTLVGVRIARLHVQELGRDKSCSIAGNEGLLGAEHSAYARVNGYHSTSLHEDVKMHSHVCGKIALDLRPQRTSLREVLTLSALVPLVTMDRDWWKSPMNRTMTPPHSHSVCLGVL